ncbi:MAG: hypothetical protein WEB06_18530 [Actinomycetota bacterium]
MDQIVQLAGALFILSAFILAQMNRLRPESAVYLLLNFVGAGLLSVVALIDRDWGFVLLEVVWTLVSGAGLVRLSRGRGRRVTA